MTPKAPVAPSPARQGKARPPIEERKVEAFDWHSLIDSYVHEIKIAIAEALDWIGQPLSAKELWLLLDLGKHDYSAVAYHARTLEKQGLTREVWAREARGATEVYYLPGGEANE